MSWKDDKVLKCTWKVLGASLFSLLLVAPIILVLNILFNIAPIDAIETVGVVALLVMGMMVGILIEERVLVWEYGVTEE